MRGGLVAILVIRRIEQIVLVGPRGGPTPGEPFLVEMDVTGRAGAAAAAQSEQLVEAIVADILHDAPSRCAPLRSVRCRRG